MRPHYHSSLSLSLLACEDPGEGAPGRDGQAVCGPVRSRFRLPSVSLSLALSPSLSLCKAGPKRRGPRGVLRRLLKGGEPRRRGVGLPGDRSGAERGVLRHVLWSPLWSPLCVNCCQNASLVCSSQQIQASQDQDPPCQSHCQCCALAGAREILAWGQTLSSGTHHFHQGGFVVLPASNRIYRPKPLAHHASIMLAATLCSPPVILQFWRKLICGELAS